MSDQAVSGECLLLELPHVPVNGLTVFAVYVHILSVNISGRFTIQMQAWMIQVDALKSVLVELAEGIGCGA